MIHLAFSLISPAAGPGVLLAQYRPFIDPLPIYSWWFWLLLPLCLLFSIVYKAVKLDVMSQVPRAAIAITFWILLSMAAAAGGLVLLDKLL